MDRAVARGGDLLVEFAILLAKWLRALRDSPQASMHYASMDFEEAPVVAARVSGTGEVVFSSAFVDTELQLASLEEATRAVQQYLSELEAALDERLGVKLQAIIEHNIDA